MFTFPDDMRVSPMVTPIKKRQLERLYGKEFRGEYQAKAKRFQEERAGSCDLFHGEGLQRI
jgi:hypothetical protein